MSLIWVDILLEYLPTIYEINIPKPQEGSNTEFQAPLENGRLLSEIILFCLGIFW